jgi:hypothetical protein
MTSLSLMSKITCLPSQHNAIDPRRQQDISDALRVELYIMQGRADGNHKLNISGKYTKHWKHCCQASAGMFDASSVRWIRGGHSSTPHVCCCHFSARGYLHTVQAVWRLIAHRLAASTTTCQGQTLTYETKALRWQRQGCHAKSRASAYRFNVTRATQALVCPGLERVPLEFVPCIVTRVVTLHREKHCQSVNTQACKRRKTPSHCLFHRLQTKYKVSSKW